MRHAFASLFVAIAALPLGATFACSSDSPQCECPVIINTPLVVIDLPCYSGPQPTLTLTGVCAGTQDTTVAGTPTLGFAATMAGTCHYKLTFVDGSTSEGDVEFASNWLACGSNPHGCGEFFTVEGRTTQSPDSVITLGTGCADAGDAAAIDAADAAAIDAGDAAAIDAGDASATDASAE